MGRPITGPGPAGGQAVGAVRRPVQGAAVPPSVQLGRTTPAVLTLGKQMAPAIGTRRWRDGTPVVPGVARRSGRTRLRVVVVDDDDVNRNGEAALLSAHPDIQVSATLTHDEALAGHIGRWASADLVIVDAADRRRPGDQFPGVSVVEQIRRCRPDGLTIVVVTGHFFDDAVRRRMREAKADFFYHRAEFLDARSLYEAVCHPEQGRRVVPGPVDPEAQFRYGVTDDTRVNQAVRYAVKLRLEERLDARADPRSRSWLRLRSEFNQVARLTPVTSDGRRPDRHQTLPSLPQIKRFLTWAMKVKEYRPPDL